MPHRINTVREMGDTKLEVLAEHYSNTFSAIQAGLKKRDKLFASMLILLFVMLIQLYAPTESSDFIAKLIAEKLESDEQVNFIYVQSALWFILVAASVKYFQTVVLINRQYDYIHSLESIISIEYEGQAFTREGAAYLKNYPAFLNWASFLYTVFFPAIFVVITAAKIFNEFRISGGAEPLVWFDALMFLFGLVSVGLYLTVLHFNRADIQGD